MLYSSNSSTEIKQSCGLQLNAMVYFKETKIYHVHSDRNFYLVTEITTFPNIRRYIIQMYMQQEYRHDIQSHCNWETMLNWTKKNRTMIHHG